MIRRPPRSTLFPYPPPFRSRIQLEHHARLAERLVWVDERAVDVAAFHEGFAERDASGLCVPDGRRGAGVRERHDHVGLDRSLLRQLVAHADARILQLAVLEDRIRPREVDELEYAHRVLARGLEGNAVHAMLVHDDHLAGLNLTDEGGVHRVQRAGLGRDHVRGLPGQWDVADAKGSEPEWVAQSDELLRSDDPA